MTYNINEIHDTWGSVYCVLTCSYPWVIPQDRFRSTFCAWVSLPHSCIGNEFGNTRNISVDFFFFLFVRNTLFAAPWTILS